MRDLLQDGAQRLMDFEVATVWGAGHGDRAGVTPEMAEKMKALDRESRELKQANAGFVLDALEQAVHQQLPGTGLVNHGDRGSQYLSIKYTERLAEADIEPSVGSVGDPYDNAIAETINGPFKAAVIHRRGPWRSFDAVE